MKTIENKNLKFTKEKHLEAIGNEPPNPRGSDNSIQSSPSQSDSLKFKEIPIVFNRPSVDDSGTSSDELKEENKLEMSPSSYKITYNAEKAGGKGQKEEKRQTRYDCKGVIKGKGTQKAFNVVSKSSTGFNEALQVEEDIIKFEEIEERRMNMELDSEDEQIVRVAKAGKGAGKEYGVLGETKTTEAEMRQREDVRYKNYSTMRDPKPNSRNGYSVLKVKEIDKKSLTNFVKAKEISSKMSPKSKESKIVNSNSQLSEKPGKIAKKGISFKHQRKGSRSNSVRKRNISAQKIGIKSTIMEKSIVNNSLGKLDCHRPEPGFLGVHSALLSKKKSKKDENISFSEVDRLKSSIEHYANKWNINLSTIKKSNLSSTIEAKTKDRRGFLSKNIKTRMTVLGKSGLSPTHLAKREESNQGSLFSKKGLLKERNLEVIKNFSYSKKKSKPDHSVQKRNSELKLDSVPREVNGKYTRQNTSLEKGAKKSSKRQNPHEDLKIISTSFPLRTKGTNLNQESQRNSRGGDDSSGIKRKPNSLIEDSPKQSQTFKANTHRNLAVIPLKKWEFVKQSNNLLKSSGTIIVRFKMIKRQISREV